MRLLCLNQQGVMMSFSMTVLGCGTPYPRPDVACSGYLLQADDVEIWVDAGPGTLANLQRHTRLDKLAAIWLSHLHIDHCNDLLPSYYALAYGGQAPSSPIPVFGPAGWVSRMEGFLASSRPDPMRLVFEPHELADGHTAGFGGLTLNSIAVEHGVPAYGLRASYDGVTFGYSGDAGPCDGLDAVARDADVFCCEAGTASVPDDVPQWHCRPQDAGQAAARSAARRLLLTHVGLDYSPSEAAAVAAAEFGSDVGFLSDGDIIRLA
jgi:ribonuclease BN (tRNA processing enzyme)